MITTNDLSAYFLKIGLVDNPSLTIDGMTALHNAQHRCMPFENFDIHLGKGVSVELDDIVQKLVYTQRGGYCFELNELMFQALNVSGFKVKRQLARVHKGPEPTGRSHQVSLVNLDGQMWVVDTGFGSHTPRSPLPIVFDREISTDTQVFRFIKDELFGDMLQIHEKNEEDYFEWQSLYSLDYAHVCNGDIQTSNFFVSHSPGSFFVGNRIAAFPLANGIVTLLNHSIKVVENNEVREIALKESESYIVALKEHFGIVLDVHVGDLKALPEPS